MSISHSLTKALCTVLLAVPLCALAQMAPPSTLPPSSLPPLPKGTSLPPLPQTSLPPLPQTNTVEQPVVQQSVEKRYSTELLTQMLEKETARIANAVSPAFTVQLLPTDNPQYKQFISQGILNMSSAEYEKHDYGLGGLMVMGGRINTVRSEVCYILFDAERGEDLWKRFIAPLGEGNHEQTGAAWVIGHEVGHCLDQRERATKINSKLSWNADDARTLGLWPNAVRRTYGNSFAKDAYLTQPNALMSLPSQQQYGERVADIFATFWTLKLGADAKLINVARDIRDKTNPAAPHYTVPVFDALKTELSFATRQVRVDVMWDIARNVQRQVGVSAQADNATPQANYANSTQDSGPPKVARWIVTARGPVPVDMYGNVIQQQTVVPTQKNFKDLPRFGK